MSEPIVTVDEVRRRVLDLIRAGVGREEAVNAVAVALHASVERVEEIFCGDREHDHA